MKKTLIAAALLAGFAGAASAQSSVTLYGVVDMGIQFQNIKSGDNYTFGTGTKNSMSSFGMVSGVQNGSRWGLKGVEDLGGGLKANFVYEAGVNATTGGNAVGEGFARQSTLGLSSSSWGALDLGRRTAPSTYAFSGIDPFASGFGGAALTSSFGTNFIRYSNMVMYTTPNFSGFTAALGYSFNTGLATYSLPSSTNLPVGPLAAPFTYETNNKTRAISIGLRYANGPLVVAGSWDRINAPSSLTLDADKIDVWNLGAAYDFKVVKLHAAYGQQIGGVVNTQQIGGDWQVGNRMYQGGALFAAGARTQSWMVGLSAPIGDNVKVFGSVQQMVAGGSFKTAPVQHMANQTIASIGASYDLSKRTNFYAYYSYANNVAMLDGVKSNTVAVGIRHRF